MFIQSMHFNTPLFKAQATSNQELPPERELIAKIKENPEILTMIDENTGDTLFHKLVSAGYTQAVAAVHIIIYSNQQIKNQFQYTNQSMEHAFKNSLQAKNLSVAIAHTQGLLQKTSPLYQEYYVEELQEILQKNGFYHRISLPLD